MSLGPTDFPQASLNKSVDACYKTEDRGPLRVSDDVSIAESDVEGIAPRRSIDPSKPRRVRKSAKGRAKHKADKSFVNQQSKFQSYLSIDWRVPLAELERHTEEGGNDRVERVEVSQKVAPKLKEVVSRNETEIRFKTGCCVRVQDGGESNWAVLLRGSSSSIDMAKELVARVVSTGKSRSKTNQTTKPSSALPLKSNTDVSMRTEWNRSSLERQIRADRIPRPEKWTVVSFADYVERLARSEVSVSMHRHLYAEGETHKELVAKLLKDLLGDPQNKPYISIQAFNSALSFFVSHNMIAAARLLFVKMDLQQIGLTTETFNILIRGAAAAKDLHNFTFLLRLMIKRGIKPNGATWVAFLMAIETKEVKKHVIKSMYSKGLLQDISIVQDVMVQTIPDHFSTFLDSQQQQSGEGESNSIEVRDKNNHVLEFVKQIDSVFHQSWLTVYSSNCLLNILGYRGLLSQCLSLIELMHKRNISPDVVSLNTLLAHCLHHHNANGAVELTRLLTSPPYNIVLDDTSYDLLFMLAWRLGFHNMSRVAWAYACVAGAVSNRMLRKVAASLALARSSASDVRDEGDKREEENDKGSTSESDPASVSFTQFFAEAFPRDAGLIVAGATSPTVPTLKPKLTSTSISTRIRTTESNSSPTSFSATPSKYRPNHDPHVAADLAAVLTRRPTRPFTELLEEALKRDRQWRYHSKTWQLAKSAQWRRDNALDVGFLRR
ncbi:MAG: hypothetical protein M1819_001373 [Sarea resinae]|nr:MAG: hypothetical protein M1819_001373 [Sarea resinae]